MFSDGMFFDGTIYATISRNLAVGMGEFWKPHLTSTLMSDFYEHPPLAFWLEGAFFKLFGDWLWVERLYSLFTFALTGYVIAKIWQQIAGNDAKQLAWLPLLLWISIPGLQWAIPNNMLENTMMVFTSLSVLFAIRSLVAKRYLYLLLSGCCIFLAFLTKGFVGLFPLSIIFWVAVLGRDIKFKRVIIDTSLMLAAAAVVALLTYTIAPSSFHFIKTYIAQQVVGSIAEVKTVSSRFYNLKALLQDLIPAIVLVLLVFITTRKHKIVTTHSRWALILFCVGLSGVLPIMVSMKQRSFYIVAALPMFSIALALFVEPRVRFLMDRIRTTALGFRIFRVVSVVLLSLTIVAMVAFSFTVGRDKQMVADSHAIARNVPKHSTINVYPSELWENWALHAYLMRYGYISLEAAESLHKQYILVDKNYEFNADGYDVLDIQLNNYNLLKKQ